MAPGGLSICLRGAMLLAHNGYSRLSTYWMVLLSNLRHDLLPRVLASILVLTLMRCMLPWPTAVHTVLALAAVDNMHLKSVDISSAFLHGVVDVELYMKFLEGFLEDILSDVVHQPSNSDACAKLQKGIYGLKQGANLWKKMHA